MCWLTPFLITVLLNINIMHIHRIVIQLCDLYTLPCKNYISIEGHWTFNETITIVSQSLTNYFPTFLFDEVPFELNNVDIDQTKKVGITTLMKNICSLESSEKNGMLVSGWDRKTTFDMKNRKHFNVILPLKKLFCGLKMFLWGL